MHAIRYNDGMRLAWLTDIHLNFVDAFRFRELFAEVRDRADAVAISGDIAESRDVCHYLRRIDEIVQKPIFFVLGNHDFYRGSVAQTRRIVTSLTEDVDNLKYLTAMRVVPLTERTAIVGHDGWADGQFGDYWGTSLILNDHLLIAEMSRWFDGSRVDKKNLLSVLMSLGDEAAKHFAAVLEEAAGSFPNIIAVTHVPPFREAAWHQGRPSSDDYLPYFACKAVGDSMVAVMQKHPQATLTVLCGHTHGGGEFQAADNIRVLTGDARYGKPKINNILDVA